MQLLLLIPAVLSFLLLGAHFLRDGSLVLTGVSLAVPVLLIPRRFVVRTLQVLLVVAILLALMLLLTQYRWVLLAIQELLVIAALLATVLLIPHRWLPRVLQVVLVIAALEWLRTAVMLAEDRMAEGDPWKRMAIILGGVALWTLCSALLFETPPLRRRYRRAKIERDPPRADAV